MAENGGDISRPGQHLDRHRASFEQQGKDPGAFVRSHMRRLEALCRDGHLQRIDEDHWRVPKDLPERRRAYDASRDSGGLAVRPLSILDLE